MKNEPSVSGGWLQFNRAAAAATAGRPIGERHLVAVLERGPHGLLIATAGIMVACRGVRNKSVGEVERFSFETPRAARDWLMAWLYYRAVKGKAPQ